LLLTALLGTGATLLLKAAPQVSLPARQPPEARPERAEARGERLPQGVVARMGSTRLRHGDAVYFAAYTPDGKGPVTAGRDRTVRLWDLATGKVVRRFDWPQGQPDTKAEPSEGGITQRWEHQLWDDLALSSQAALSPDGKVVAASRGGVVCLWELATGKKLHHLQTGEKYQVHLAFSPDGKSLATLGPAARTFAVWEVATGKCVRSRQVELPAGYSKGLIPFNEQNAIVSPGWKYCAYQFRDPSGIRWIGVRDLATGKDLPPIHSGGYGGTLAFCFSADEKT